MGFIAEGTATESHDTESLVKKPTKTERISGESIAYFSIMLVIGICFVGLIGYFAFGATSTLISSVKTRNEYENGQSWCIVTGYHFTTEFCCDVVNGGPYICNTTTLNLHLISTSNSSVTYDGTVRTCTDYDTSIKDYNNAICYHMGNNIVKVVPRLSGGGICITVFANVAFLVMVSIVIAGIIVPIRQSMNKCQERR